MGVGKIIVWLDDWHAKVDCKGSQKLHLVSTLAGVQEAMTDRTSK